MINGILNAVQNIKAVLGISNPTSSGTDTAMNYMRKLDKKIMQPVQAGGQVSATTETNLLSISGKGELNQAALFSNSSNKGYLKIYVDGTLKFYGSAISPADKTITGVLMATCVSADTYGISIPYIGAKTVGNGYTALYPYTDGVEGRKIPMHCPIPFQTSLVISAWVSGGTDVMFGIDYKLEV